MKRLVWLSDIHLNFVPGQRVYDFFDEVAAADPDVVVITGDIAEANDVGFYLEEMSEVLARPICFVLGNHDFYGGSIATVRTEMNQLTAGNPYLRWLSGSGVIELTETTALVGHEGWADGRLGDYARSEVLLNDYLMISELSGLSKPDRLRILNRLGDESAAHFRRILPVALAKYPRVIVATHVPPFRDACWRQGQPSADDWLPHMACKATGQALSELMQTHPAHNLTVLCGHTHSPGQAHILPNLHTLTAAAEYGQPAVQKVLEIT